MELGSIPPPGIGGGVAWGLGIAATLAAVGGHRRAAASLVAASSGVTLVVALGPSVPPGDVGQAAMAWMRGAGGVVHGALAVVVALTALAGTLPRPGAERSSGTLLAAFAAIGVSTGLGAVAAGPTPALLVLLVGAMLAVGALAGRGPRGGPLALAIAALLLVAVDWMAQGAAYRGLFDWGPAAGAARIEGAWQHVLGVRVAAPGALVAIVLATVLGERGGAAPSRAFSLVALPVLVAAGAVLGLRRDADSARLGPPPVLRSAWNAEPAARCIASLSDAPTPDRWDRWDGGCDPPARVGIRVDGETSARRLLQDWGSGELEILVGRDGRADIPPLRQLRVGASPLRVVLEPVPHRFDQDEGVTLQLDAWLDGHLGRPASLAPGHLWVVDSPRGTLLLLHGTGVTAGARAVRRGLFERLLVGTEEPALALVVGERWTVAEVLDICADARLAAGAELPCVLTAPGTSPR